MKNNQLVKPLLFGFIFFIALIFSNKTQAQYNPYDDGSKIFTVGIGATGWGIPIFGRLEVPVADNITVGGNVSYQSYSEKYSSYKWRHTIIGFGVLGNYHFNELFQISDEWDVYGGATLGYYVWNTKYDDNGSSFDYSGSGDGGFSLGLQIGGRYFFKDNMAVNLELGGGTVLSNGTVGLSILF